MSFAECQLPQQIKSNSVVTTACVQPVGDMLYRQICCIASKPTADPCNVVWVTRIFATTWASRHSQYNPVFIRHISTYAHSCISVSIWLFHSFTNLNPSFHLSPKILDTDTDVSSGAQPLVRCKAHREHEKVQLQINDSREHLMDVDRCKWA
jgi:hypothetical protein